MCQAILPKADEKPIGVVGLFAYRHAPERLGSRTPWNKSSVYVLNTHYKSEIFKSVILSVLYRSRHDLRIYIRKNFVSVSVNTRILFVKNRSNHFEIHLELTDKSSLQNFVTTIRRPGMRLDDIGTNNAYAGSGIIPDRHGRY